jgi:serine/threonine protein kinase
MPDANRNLMTIFAEALERSDEAARAAYLHSACGDDAALRERVEALLAAHEGAGRFLEPDSCAMSGTAAPETQGAPRASVPETRASSQMVNKEQRSDGATTTIAGPGRADRPHGFVAGQVIAGRYTLLDVLGEGGMGTVYRADQTEPVKRQVALRLIKVGMDSRAVLARFDAERQALALMNHPNIARVYDGGTTTAGQPFFVIELVSGVPITEYCDRHRLSVRARLELFVSVCQAVQHAHQKGIIHRDLKPGNVLVTEVDGRPTPNVIDFGVAKATDVKLTDQSFADSGAIVGTPAYMSPEQADPSSMDTDTRTDVYALGVILYELLAGSPPIDAKLFQRGAFLEMLRMVREVDPPRPSTKVSGAEALPNIAASRDIEPEQLKRALRGDLDWIVMKALEKDRARRYETANGFAADVLRHLSYEPVLAAPPSRAYRLRKFVRKHRGAVVAASLVVLALLGGIAGTTWGLIRAQRARAAEARRVKERDAAIKVADDRATDLSYQLGISAFLLASAAYDNGDVKLAADRLGNVPPDQRGWDWHYLKRLTRGGLFTLYGHAGPVLSVAFSRDGTRILTGSTDRTAKVWDARMGTPLLELKGHAGRVQSVSFSPDGTRIVTGSEDQTAKVWDARTGTLLLELKGHTSQVESASFSPDGTRIVTASGDQTAKVWDARTGQEIKGEPIPTTARPGQISPDGRWIAHVIDNRVELIPLQPDEEELADRQYLTQPNFRLYREAYNAASKANDGFAARFYLNLFPPPERALIRAEAIVPPLFARWLLRDDVLAALEAQPVADPVIQAACLKLAGAWPESASECNNAGWAVVRDPGRPEIDYQRGLRLARAACRLEPESVAFLDTLGVAQYRCRLMAEALATLTRSNDRNHQDEPSDLAFLALAQHRLGQPDKVRGTLARLRELMKDPQRSEDAEAKAFAREAETIELDRVFPADPFAR